MLPGTVEGSAVCLTRQRFVASRRGVSRASAEPRGAVVVCAPLGSTRQHRQQRRRAVERLNLRLLVDAQHDGVRRRVDIQAHDVAHLVDQPRVGATA